MRFRRQQPSRALLSPLHVELAPEATQMVRNLLVTRSGAVWAGYRLGPARWDFTGDKPKSLLLESVTDVYGELLGRDYRERVTTRPHPVTDWGRNLDARTPHPTGDVRSWNEYLLRQQYRISQAGMDDKIVYRMFRIGDVQVGKAGPDVMAQVVAFVRDGVPPSAEVRALLTEEKKIFETVRLAGWNAIRMTERDSGWLRMRSLAPGVPAPLIDTPGWDEANMGFFSADVRWHETPLDRTVAVTSFRDGTPSTRHVQVLTCARLDDLMYPESGLEPWQAYVERATDAEGLSFGTEWLIAGRLAEGSEVAHRAGLDLAKADSMRASYEAFEERPPERIERGIDVALEARDQITSGAARTSGRFLGTINLMVWGEDVVVNGRVIRTGAEVCEERADAVRRLYSGSDLRMQFAPPLAQAAKLREFVPGEPVDGLGYQHQVRLPYLAAGLPNVSAVVGDGRGPYIGYLTGAARRPVMHDPHFATEGRGHLGRGQNMFAVVGTLGAGKSVLLGGAIMYPATRRGIRCVVRDPSGPLAALTQMPELEPFSTEINLLRGESGILNPPSLVRDPRAEEFQEGDIDQRLDAHRDASNEAKAERRGLVIETARRCLDFDLYDHPATLEVLRRAADLVAETGEGWTISSTLWHLIYALNADEAPHASAVASALRSASVMPLLRLLFPPESAGHFQPKIANTSVLTVITTPGVRRAPDSVHRSDWGSKELAADVILRLTSLYTDRLLFDKPMGERAIAIFDEAEDMTDSGVGRGYLSRLGRDHSKWNIAVYLGLKNVTQEMIGGEIRNFLAGAWIGRMADGDSAEAMLDILHVTDRRYADVLMRLSQNSPGEFVHLDVEGRVGQMKVDVDYNPALRDVLMTNPENEGSAAWALTEEAMA